MGARWVAPLAAAAGLLGLLVGCGGDDGTASTNTGAEETTERESATTTERETTDSTTTTSTTTEAPPTTLATSGEKPWSNLRTGECVADLPGGTFVEVELARCDEPHAAEVIGIERIFPDPLRGLDVEDQAQGSCEGDFEEYAGRPFDGSGLVVSTLISAPEPPSGPGRPTIPGAPPLPNINESLVICLAESADGAPLTTPIAS